MSGTGYLTGRHIYLATAIGEGNTTTSALLTLFPVHYDYAVFPSGYRFGRTNYGAERVLTMVAGSGKVGQERPRKFTVFKRGYPPPVGWPGRYIMPILTGYTTGEAPDTSSLVKIKASLH